MKKYLVLITMLFIAAIAVIAQEQPDTINIVVDPNQSVVEILKSNLWSLVLFAFILLDTWLAQTGKVKEGSVLAWILNFIGKLLRKKGDILKTQKGKFMTDEQLKQIRK